MQKNAGLKRERTTNKTGRVSPRAAWGSSTNVYCQLLVSTTSYVPICTPLCTHTPVNSSVTSACILPSNGFFGVMMATNPL